VIPPELPPEPADQDAARADARLALSHLAIESELAYRKADSGTTVEPSRAQLETFVERAKQLLNVIATSAAVLP
jgi:hypothetical protein